MYIREVLEGIASATANSLGSCHLEEEEGPNTGLLAPLESPSRGGRTTAGQG